MGKSSRSIDEQIRNAIKNGAFDNLPGKGKPLDVDHNPHEDPGWGIAYHMLRSSGYTLPWIETRQSIEAEYESAVKSLARSWSWRRSALDQNQPRNIVENEWQRALTAFEEIILTLNKQIFNYNLEVPSDQFARQNINLKREISKITNQVD
jgi:DnaJ family protein C protein 28